MSGEKRSTVSIGAWWVCARVRGVYPWVMILTTMYSRGDHPEACFRGAPGSGAQKMSACSSCCTAKVHRSPGTSWLVHTSISTRKTERGRWDGVPLAHPHTHLGNHTRTPCPACGFDQPSIRQSRLTRPCTCVSPEQNREFRKRRCQESAAAGGAPASVAWIRHPSRPPLLFTTAGWTSVHRVICSGQSADNH